jgi:hypothetical protein
MPEVDNITLQPIYAPKGSIITDFEFNPASGDSKRWDIDDPPMNCEFTGYFKGGSCDDTVSCKIRGGRHSDDDPEMGCCYIPQFPTQGGEFEYQVECPHPDNHDCDCDRIEDCDELTSSHWTGYKVAMWNTDDNCVHWEAYQDQGDSGNGDTPEPANNWVKVAEHTDCDGNCGDIDSPLLEPKTNSSQITWRIDECDLNEDDGWVVLWEIEGDGTVAPGGGGGGGTDEPPEPPDTPEGEEIPDVDQPGTVVGAEFVDMFHVGQDAGESCLAGGEVTPAELVDLWNVPATTPASYLDLFTGANKGAGIYVRNANSRLIDKLPLEWNCVVLKTGTPSGNIVLNEYDMTAFVSGAGPAVLVRQIGTPIDVTTLTTGVETTIVFDDPTNTIRFKREHIYIIEYDGGDINNKIRVRQCDIDIQDSSDTMFAYRTATLFARSPTREIPWVIKGN